MNRREFIAALGGAAAAFPTLTWAQESGRSYRLGFLNPAPRQSMAVAAFFDELRLNGFVEGQNLAVIPGGFEIRNEQVAQRAAELVKAAPDAILAGPELPLRTLQALTRTIPLVGMTEDMVAAGLVTSLLVETLRGSACFHPN
jgi:putative ABC transport system substrate-binding protein